MTGAITISFTGSAWW